MPKGVSLVSPRSRCVCGEPIPWYHNLPILSWFILRGKAACCGAKFSFRYPFVELLTALAFLYLWAFFPLQEAFVGMIFFSLMLVVSFIDLDTMELSDSLTVGGFVLGLVLSALFPQIHTLITPDKPFIFFALKGIIFSLIGAICGAGVLAIFKVISEYMLKKDAMGEGDIVLLAAIGAFCGWQGALFSIFGGSVVGALILLPIMLFYKIFRPQKEFNTIIPFGPWLAIGGVLYYFFFHRITNQFFADIIYVFFQS